MKLRQAALHAGTDIESILAPEEATVREWAIAPPHMLTAVALYCVSYLADAAAGQRHNVVVDACRR